MATGKVKARGKAADGKGGWIVQVRCTVIKEVVCEDCTEAEALADPWEHAVDEVEQHQEDWAVMDVRRND